MKKNLIFLTLFFSVCSLCYSQPAFYDILPGEGNGIRFWNSILYKISMGSASEYHYGPVTGYSIKTTMTSDAGWGWTWGEVGQSPVAALNNQGAMQIAGKLGASKFSTGQSLDSKKYALWDDASNWYGIGVQSGQVRFQVGSSAARFSFLSDDTNEIFTINGNGNVGIGTATPSNVGGWDKVFEVASPYHAKITATSASQSVRMGLFSHSTLNGGVGEIGTETNHGVHFLTNFQIRMTLTAGGNLGIGTISPDQLLTVNGTIHSKEVKVDLSVPGPDYVFEKSYTLPSLDQVKSYIDENKHLPEVPSAAEMEKNGINVSEMNMLLLKKVEELTLYVIELKQENRKQQEMIEKINHQ